jgi:hypothetical protein
VSLDARLRRGPCWCGACLADERHRSVMRRRPSTSRGMRRRAESRSTDGRRRRWTRSSESRVREPWRGPVIGLRRRNDRAVIGTGCVGRQAANRARTWALAAVSQAVPAREKGVVSTCGERKPSSLDVAPNPRHTLAQTLRSEAIVRQRGRPRGWRIARIASQRLADWRAVNRLESEACHHDGAAPYCLRCANLFFHMP